MIKRALEHAESFGVTSVQDMGPTYDDIAVYADLADRGELTVRVYALTPEAGWYHQAKLGLRRAFGSPSLRIGGVRVRFGVAGRPARAPHPADRRRPRRPAAVAPGRGEARASEALRLLTDIAAANGGRDRRFRVDLSPMLAAHLDRLASINAVGPVPRRTSSIRRREP